MNKTTILAEFDKRFPLDKSSGEMFYTRRVVKDYISNSIDSLLKSVEEKCEEMKYQQPLLGTPETTERVILAVNDALTDLKSSIKSLYL